MKELKSIRFTFHFKWAQTFSTILKCLLISSLLCKCVDSSADILCHMEISGFEFLNSKIYFVSTNKNQDHTPR